MNYATLTPTDLTLRTLAEPTLFCLGAVSYSDYRLSGNASSSVTTHLVAKFDGIEARVQFGDNPNVYAHKVFEFAESLHGSINDAMESNPYRVSCAFTALAHVFTLTDELDVRMIPSLVKLATLVACHDQEDNSQPDDIEYGGADGENVDYWDTYQMQARDPKISVVDFSEIVQRYMEGFYAARSIQITAPRVNGTWGLHLVSGKWLRIHGVSNCCTFIRAADGEDGEIKEMLTAAIGSLVHTDVNNEAAPEHDEAYLSNYELDELSSVVEEFQPGHFVGESIDSIVPGNYSLGSLDADFNAIDIYEDMFEFTIVNHEDHNVITTTKIDELSASLA